jgi:hypothetical protein
MTVLTNQDTDNFNNPGPRGVAAYMLSCHAVHIDRLKKNGKKNVLLLLAV